jgi:phytoene dehydrogenase-like protein
MPDRSSRRRACHRGDPLALGERRREVPRLYRANQGSSPVFSKASHRVPVPDIDARSLDDLLPLIGVGRKFRALGRVDMIELLRTLPMSVWELVDDWFECAPLKAAIAATGIQDLQQGPRSGGTGFVLLHQLVGAPPGSVRGRTPWRTGPAAFASAVEGVARRAGVAVRTAAAVARLEVVDEVAKGVVLEGGETIEAKAVISTADPAQTFLDWVDPVWLDPEFIHAVRNIRYRGCTAFVLYALDAPPPIAGLASEAFAGVVSLSSRVEAIERAADGAKYGTVSEAPHIELSMPTSVWPDLAPSSKHILVARVQYAPYRLRQGAWDAARRDALADIVTRAIEKVAPGFGSRVLHRTAWSPLDLEERYGLHQGAVSRRAGSRQILFSVRSRVGAAPHADRRTISAARRHPGPGVLGGPGWLAAHRVLKDRKTRT